MCKYRLIPPPRCSLSHFSLLCSLLSLSSSINGPHSFPLSLPMPVSPPPPPPLPSLCSCTQFIPVIFSPSVPFHCLTLPPSQASTQLLSLSSISESVVFKNYLQSPELFQSRNVHLDLPVIVANCIAVQVFSCLLDKDLCFLLWLISEANAFPAQL